MRSVGKACKGGTESDRVHLACRLPVHRDLTLLYRDWPQDSYIGRRAEFARLRLDAPPALPCLAASSRTTAC